MMVEKVRAQWFLGPVNSLAAMGKKPEKLAPQIVSKNNTGSAALRAVLPVITLFCHHHHPLPNSTSRPNS